MDINVKEVDKTWVALAGVQAVQVAVGIHHLFVNGLCTGSCDNSMSLIKDCLFFNFYNMFSSIVGREKSQDQY